MRLTVRDAEEVTHKMYVLSDTPDLLEDYSLTPEQARILIDSIPRKGGKWEIPDFALAAVKGEMQDHAVVLRDMSADAFSDNDIGSALGLAKQSKRLWEMFQ